jgi:hypothetical protein
VLQIAVQGGAVEEILVSATGRAPGLLAARGAWGLAMVLGLSACAGDEFRRIPRQTHPTSSAASSAIRQNREAEMNRQWQNKPLSELLGTYGRPRMVMNIPGGGMPPSYAVVYGPDATSGCIDAFAVSSHGDPVVRLYHCR